MEVEIEIKRRNREYGIFTWTIDLDSKIKSILDSQDIINITFNGTNLRSRKVSYGYRKFNLGKKRIENVGNKKYFVISNSENGVIINTK